MRVFVVAIVLLSLSQGCITGNSDKLSLAEKDMCLYRATQEALLEFDEQQFGVFVEFKRQATIESTPCLERYALAYSEGYATGYAYFSLTRNWLMYMGGVEMATYQNAYLAGWYEGQLRARQEGSPKIDWQRTKANSIPLLLD